MGTVGVCLVCAKNSMSAPPPAPTPALALVKNIPRHVLAWAIETNRETKAVRFLRGRTRNRPKQGSCVKGGGGRGPENKREQQRQRY